MTMGSTARMIGFCLAAAGLPMANAVAAAERVFGPVDHVRDGDTIVVQGVAVRLLCPTQPRRALLRTT